MKTARAVAILLLSAGAACAEAGGETKGGELTPAGQQAATPPAFNAPVVDAGADCGTGSKWSELYRDIFGTGKAGSCTFASNCHGTPEGEGSNAGAGIKCFDEAGCRQSMIDQKLARPSNAAKPYEANLIAGILRQTSGTGKVVGIMPKEPGGYVYSKACIDRVAGWIANGVPAD